MICVEPKKKTQKETLLELFHRKHTWSNFELRSLQPPMFQYPVRIKELIEEGHDIRGTHHPTDKRIYLYTLYPQGQLFP